MARALMTGPVHGRIKRRRRKLDISLTNFAAQVGAHVSLACHWERGRARPPLEKIPAIARALDVSELYLVRGEKAYAAYERVLRRAA